MIATPSLSARGSPSAVAPAPTNNSSTARAARSPTPVALTGAILEIDGYNVLTTVEAALASAVMLIGRDGSYRDMASMHGNFKKVAETPKAITLIGQTLARYSLQSALWYLDAPVSNSARLKQLLLEIAAAQHWLWQVELVPDPDRILAVSPAIIASADSAILDRCPRWLSLAREVVEEHLPLATTVEFHILSPTKRGFGKPTATSRNPRQPKFG
ncbi:DUF434 domain-containing protein [Chthoniobacter flavus]|uniref:DUF434 domain-containing protein n=1 Tax=Chthoniobacter flavus TaxID=191863 RepID=UPI00138B0B7F|nr:DUF5616 domain-containing protein [Chthoniobacter flavus]